MSDPLRTAQNQLQEARRAVELCEHKWSKTYEQLHRKIVREVQKATGLKFCRKHGNTESFPLPGNKAIRLYGPSEKGGAWSLWLTTPASKDLSSRELGQKLVRSYETEKVIEYIRSELKLHLFELLGDLGED